MNSPQGSHADSQEVVLSVRDVTKVFRGKESICAVDCVSFELHRGEVLGLLGPNGAGKTTLIRMLISVLTPSAGQIEFFGKDLAKERSAILQKVAYASTYTYLPLFLTVRENLNIHGRLYGMQAKERKQRIEEYLEYFGIAHLQNQRFTQLSAGQRTRVRLVKAFLPSPEIALLDEPTASLDPDVARDVRAFIAARQKDSNLSILYTSHNMEEVSSLCDRVLFLKSGRVVASDTPHKLASSISLTRLELIVHDGMKRTRGYLESEKHTYGIEDRTVWIDVPEGTAPSVIAGLLQTGIKLHDISISKPTLEDYFLKLAEDESA